MCGLTRTARPTRSGSGDTKASGQKLPLIRTLFESLVCGPQARFRTFPIPKVVGTRGGRICWIEIGDQKGRVEIPLDRTDSTFALLCCGLALLAHQSLICYLLFLELLFESIAELLLAVKPSKEQLLLVSSCPLCLQRNGGSFPG